MKKTKNFLKLEKCKIRSEKYRTSIPLYEKISLNVFFICMILSFLSVFGTSVRLSETFSDPSWLNLILLPIQAYGLFWIAYTGIKLNKRFSRVVKKQKESIEREVKLNETFEKNIIKNINKLFLELKELKDNNRINELNEDFIELIIDEKEIQKEAKKELNSKINKIDDIYNNDLDNNIENSVFIENN